ncbi:hypothetical protein LTR85_007469 [Meristemomyces frigidus]|nr:hypothetical protein LTR85_007469 [Meristemomyces frigidus]
MKLFALLPALILPASGLDDIDYGAFTQTATYSVASQLGFFAANGLNVTYLQVPNSTYGYSQLLSGGYDILTGTIDNAVNLRFNANKTLTVLGQLDGGPDLVIASVPNITSVQQLRGKALMVDNAASGYAYVLRKVLSLYGLRLENGDYSFQVVGSTNIRYQYLANGSLPDGTAVYATILTYPFTAEGHALNPPLTVLARISDFINPFASSAFTISEPTLSDNNSRVLYTRFVASFMQASRFLAEPSNANCSIQAIARQLNITTAVAQAEYAAATDSSTGETISNSTFAVNRQGLLNVIDVRDQFSGFASVSQGFSFADAIVVGYGKLIDDSVRLAAMNITPRATANTC